ncbi:hypothetical protein AALA82_03060 [Oscillospiraceae bacterium 50-16]
MVHVVAGFICEVAALNIFTVGKLAVLNCIEHLGGRIEGEKVADTAFTFEVTLYKGFVSAVNSGTVIKNEFIFGLIVLGKIFPHIVVVVSLIVNLEQTRYILKGAFGCSIPHQVEQIVKRRVLVPILNYSFANVLLGIFRVKRCGGIIRSFSRVA